MQRRFNQKWCSQKICHNITSQHDAPLKRALEFRWRLLADEIETFPPKKREEKNYECRASFTITISSIVRMRISSLKTIAVLSRANESSKVEEINLRWREWDCGMENAMPLAHCNKCLNSNWKSFHISMKRTYGYNALTFPSLSSLFIKKCNQIPQHRNFFIM